jgi:hypothetical protein
MESTSTDASESLKPDALASPKAPIRRRVFVAPDRAVAGLTACYWLLALIFATGFETRGIVNGAEPGWALALIAGYIVLVLVLAVVLARRGGAQSGASMPPRRLERAIRNRARTLGASRSLKTFILADTDGPADAYCIGLGRASAVYISAKLAADWDAADGANQKAASVMLDRALIDAATGGRATLSIATACWIIALLFLPLKFLLLALIGPIQMVMRGPDFLALSSGADAFAYLVAHFVMAGMLFAMYRRIVQRRIKFLDGAAVGVSPDKEGARAALISQLEQWRYGLHGRNLVRPRRRTRTAAINAGGVKAPGALSIALILMALFALLQTAVAGSKFTIAGDAIGAFSAIALIALSFLFATMMTEGEYTGFRPLRMIIYATVIAGGLAAAVWLLFPVTGPAFDPDGLDALREAARLEIVMLILSAPVTILALFLGQIVSQRFFQAELGSLEGRIVSAGAGAVAAGFILWAVMLACWHPHQNYLEARFEAYDAYLVQEAEAFNGVGITAKEWLDSKRLAARAMADKGAFHPPLSLIMLWQSPIQVEP